MNYHFLSASYKFFISGTTFALYKSAMNKLIFKGGYKMKKVLLIGVCALMLFVAAKAEALYIETLDVYDVGTSVTLSWNHTYDGSASPEAEAFLTIIAEGIDDDGASLVETDLVYFNGNLLGELTKQNFYNPGFQIKPGPGALGSPLTELTTSIFTLDLAWLNVGNNLVNVVIDPSNWIMEVETSTLSVTPVPEPGTIILLGSGLIGLVFARRKMK